MELGNTANIVQQFIQKLENSLIHDHFVKLTLSKPSEKGAELRNVYVRSIVLKGHPSLSFTMRYPTKDIAKNYSIQDGLSMVTLWLGQDFLNADLFTTEENVSLQFNKKRKPRMFSQKPSHADVPSKNHDKQKNRFINPKGNHYLEDLGITNQDGAVLKSGQKKFRQINKYIEIINTVLTQANLKPPFEVVDVGAGKGYLTFALYDFLSRQSEEMPHITGVELRPELVEKGNDLAKRAGFKGLEFVVSDIMAYEAKDINLLIALHACDVATDIAIAKGIKSNAKVIIVAPCCHKQVRKQMDCQSDLQAVLKHGILEERQAELITDGIRSLLLEANGYQTKVFEFISTEHTPKNVMIVGIKGKKDENALEKVDAIKRQFGIDYHYLEKLLVS